MELLASETQKQNNQIVAHYAKKWMNEKVISKTFIHLHFL